MRNRRFGHKIKLPSTFAIKYQIVMMMLEAEIRETPSGAPFDENSPALAMLRKLGGLNKGK